MAFLVQAADTEFLQATDTPRDMGVDVFHCTRIERLW